jgi:hypothetical protein
MACGTAAPDDDDDDFQSSLSLSSRAGPNVLTMMIIENEI